MGGSPPSDRNQPRRGDNSIHPVTIDSSSAAQSGGGGGHGYRSTSRNYQRNQPFKSWFPWLIPSFFVANIALFIITMYVNNCPKNSINCVADFLGRFSFQPMKENPLLGPSSTSLDKMGAQQVSKVVDGHQGWRLITAIWLHAGVFHLLANMLSLLFIGIRLEQEFGFVRIGLLYLISGFGGNVLSALFIRGSIAVGASGALFGLLGAMLSELITNWTIYANKLAALLTLLLIIVINLAVGILPHVDNFAHIGGFGTGFLLGFVFLIRPQFGWVSPKNVPPGYVRSSKPKYKMYQIILLVAALVLLIVGFDKNGGFEDVALRFSVIIWDQIECNYTFNIGDQGKELLDRMIETMKLAVAGCSESNQSLILEKAYIVLSSTCFLLKESMPSSVPMEIEDSQRTQSLNPLSCRDEWVISLFSSVIIALRPHTPVQNVRGILKLFISVLGNGHLPVAHALGSVINKLPLNRNIVDVSSACTLEEAMDIVSEMILCCSTRLRKYNVVNNGDETPTRTLKVGDCDLVEPNAIVGLAWIGKGLVMRGNEKVRDIVMVFMRCLTCSKLENTLLQGSSEQDMFSLVMRSAADAFRVILSDSDVCLNKRFHATLKPLYKQHFFSTMTPILLTSIKECDSQTTRCFLYRAFGNIISNAPLAAVVNEAKVLIFVLLDGLSILSKSVQDRDLTYSLLLVLSGLIMDESGREAVTENARSTINRLIGLISYPHMMLVRETAIQCLVAMTGLPHTRIFPMRTQVCQILSDEIYIMPPTKILYFQVLQAISKALDDPKRSVRQEAVSCRQAWASIASM